VNLRQSLRGLASLKAEATAWLSGPSYDVLRFRLEEAHSAAEAAI
jgi:hypothetical protein